MQYSDRPTYPVFRLDADASGLFSLNPGESIADLLDTAKQSAKQSKFQVFHLEGQSITNRDLYFQKIADLFQFPDYFGHNWDAVADCLTDLSWEEGDRILIVYSHSQGLSEEHDWEIAIRIWANTIEFWGQQGVMVSVVLG